jgi:hypothetical protein
MGIIIQRVWGVKVGLKMDNLLVFSVLTSSQRRSNFPSWFQKPRLTTISPSLIPQTSLISPTPSTTMNPLLLLATFSLLTLYASSRPIPYLLDKTGISALTWFHVLAGSFGWGLAFGSWFFCIVQGMAPRDAAEKARLMQLARLEEQQQEFEDNVTLIGDPSR